jgi:hypothetical protein
MAFNAINPFKGAFLLDGTANVASDLSLLNTSLLPLF